VSASAKTKPRDKGRPLLPLLMNSLAEGKGRKIGPDIFPRRRPITECERQRAWGEYRKLVQASLQDLIDQLFKQTFLHGTGMRPVIIWRRTP
jgi:hypothetical protein